MGVPTTKASAISPTVYIYKFKLALLISIHNVAMFELKTFECVYSCIVVLIWVLFLAKNTECLFCDYWIFVYFSFGNICSNLLFIFIGMFVIYYLFTILYCIYYRNKSLCFFSHIYYIVITLSQAIHLLVRFINNLF